MKVTNSWNHAGKYVATARSRIRVGVQVKPLPHCIYSFSARYGYAVCRPIDLFIEEIEKGGKLRLRLFDRDNETETPSVQSYLFAVNI